MLYFPHRWESSPGKLEPILPVFSGDWRMTTLTTDFRARVKELRERLHLTLR